MLGKNLNLETLVCPCSSHARLTLQAEGLLCTSENCCHSDPRAAFRIVGDIPVMISALRCDTLCNPDRVQSYVSRRPKSLDWIKALVMGEGSVTKTNCEEFLHLTRKSADNPRILIIGSGEKGMGTNQLWNDPQCSRVGIDIYASETVDVICDAHYLPFPDQSYDGVWIQAVLEHVVEPQVVTAEIHRVLRPSGLVYAETPFMQQVHESAYDFTRFTVTGHRYLFRDFDMIRIGGNGGAELSLAWSVKYFTWAVTRSAIVAKLTGALAQIILRPFGVFVSKASLFDSSSGTFFLGRKSERRISHHDLVAIYRGQG